MGVEEQGLGLAAHHLGGAPEKQKPQLKAPNVRIPSVCGTNSWLSHFHPQKSRRMATSYGEKRTCLLMHQPDTAPPGPPPPPRPLSPSWLSPGSSSINPKHRPQVPTPSPPPMGSTPRSLLDSLHLHPLNGWHPRPPGWLSQLPHPLHHPATPT